MKVYQLTVAEDGNQIGRTYVLLARTIRHAAEVGLRAIRRQTNLYKPSIVGIRQVGDTYLGKH